MFNNEVQSMPEDATTARHFKERVLLFAKLKRHDGPIKDRIIAMFHKHQDELTQRPEFMKILKKYKGTIYTSDKKCSGMLAVCLRGSKWLTKLYVDMVRQIAIPWVRQTKTNSSTGGRKTKTNNKLRKLRKFRVRTRRNRSRR